MKFIHLFVSEYYGTFGPQVYVLTLQSPLQYERECLYFFTIASQRCSGFKYKYSKWFNIMSLPSHPEAECCPSKLSCLPRLFFSVWKTGWHRETKWWAASERIVPYKTLAIRNERAWNVLFESPQLETGRHWLNTLLLNLAYTSPLHLDQRSLWHIGQNHSYIMAILWQTYLPITSKKDTCWKRKHCIRWLSTAPLCLQCWQSWLWLLFIRVPHIISSGWYVIF